ncbi:MAG: thioredoxin domain-containing protein [Micrococcaceae bacterium]
MNNNDAKTRKIFLISFAIMVVLGAIIGIAITHHNNSAKAQAADAKNLKQYIRNIADDPLSKGPQNAPVTIVEYSDLRCPYCAKLYNSSAKQIEDEYVKSGKVRIEWRNYPILGDQSLKAAYAATTAGHYGKFWPYVTAIYKDAPDSGHADLTDSKLVEYAKQVGITDEAGFKKTMDSTEVKNAVKEDMDEGEVIGVEGTPTVFINGEVVDNPSYDSMKKIIDSELKAQGK